MDSKHSPCVSKQVDSPLTLRARAAKPRRDHLDANRVQPVDRPSDQPRPTAPATSGDGLHHVARHRSVLHGRACSTSDIGFLPANALVRKTGGFGLDGEA